MGAAKGSDVHWTGHGVRITDYDEQSLEPTSHEVPLTPNRYSGSISYVMDGIPFEHPVFSDRVPDRVANVGHRHQYLYPGDPEPGPDIFGRPASVAQVSYSPRDAV